MKHFALMVIGAMALASSSYAEDAHKQTTMTGWVCNSKCVSETSGHAACNQNCTEETGDLVLIDNEGRILKIVNPEKVKSYAGKKVKMNCKPAGDSNDSMYVNSISLYGGGG